MDITNTEIYQASIKIFPGHFDMEYYFELLFQFPESEWFSPTNKNDESFTVCKELSALGLICEKTSPVFSGGGYRGKRHEFFYNKNLSYDKGYDL